MEKVMTWPENYGPKSFKALIGQKQHVLVTRGLIRRPEALPSIIADGEQTGTSKTILLR